MAQPQYTTACPRCGGLGTDMLAGQMIRCDECDGEGQVPADRIVDWGPAMFGPEYVPFPPFLMPIPKEARSE